MREYVDAHVTQLFQKMFMGGDRVLTKKSISGSEFEKPLYRIWRERNPDNNFELKKETNLRWESKLDMYMGRTYGTAAHLLSYEEDNLNTGPKEHHMELDVGGLKVTGTADKIIVNDGKFAVVDYKFVASMVMGKARDLLEENNLDSKYFRGYRHQLSLYSYLFYKTNKGLDYPEKGYLIYTPRTYWSKHFVGLGYGEFNLTLPLKIYPIDYIESRLTDIKAALEEEPDFDCIVSDDCRYCNALCSYNKKCKEIEDEI